MGYESKIYFVQSYDFPEPIHHSQIVAMIDMCKMGYSRETDDFLDAFDTETDFSLYLDGYDDENKVECLVNTIEDAYGKRLCYASDKEYLYQCALDMEKSDDYWRFPILTQMIKIFKDVASVKIVHYGY